MRPLMQVFLLGVFILAFGFSARAEKFEEARIFIEFNSTDNDLGFHVFLDAEEWKKVKIINPNGVTVFSAAGKAAYGRMGLSEMFFEGAEPNLDDFPLPDLLALFPEGKYQFVGETAEGDPITKTARLSHAVPAGPSVSTSVRNGSVVIRWETVTGTPAGFPQEAVEIEGYQVIVDPFQVTLPADANKVTLPREFVRSLKSGKHDFEVLAIDKSGNQTITADKFTLP